MKCLKATIEYAPDLKDRTTVWTFDGSAAITCEFETGRPKVLAFYHDEISIDPAECVGKTWDEIVSTKRTRDLAFLQS